MIFSNFHGLNYDPDDDYEEEEDDYEEEDDDYEEEDDEE